MRMNHLPLLTVFCGVALLSPACVNAPNADPDEASETGLDPERVTPLGFYGDRCAGEPSIDGVTGVTGVRLKVGQTFVAELPYASGTPNEWIATKFDRTVVEITDKRDRPIRGSTDAGSLYMRNINFTARTPGRTRVTFEFRRAAEVGMTPIAIRQTTIYVEE